MSPRTRRKDPSDRKTEVIFVRVTPGEREIIDRAVELQFGSLESNISKFVRRAVLLVAKRVIEAKKKGD